MKKLVIVMMALLCGCTSDPEFKNCSIEIITAKDTLRLDGALVEFEGEITGVGSKMNGLTDNILIIKGNGEWNFQEKDIIKMTIIYEPSND